MSRKIKNRTWVIGAIFLFLGACLLLGWRSQFGSERKLRAEIDSLNRLSYDLRYSDLNISSKLASRAFALSEHYPELQAEALNQMGFCAFMRMDFEHALRLFQAALDRSDSEIESMIACVGMMKVCQRTSMNKGFYDYRNRAMVHMKRIREDEKLISDINECKRKNYAFSEFYIVSGIYFYYLQQQRESLEAINSVSDDWLEGDPSQQIYYEYMKGSGGMYEAENYEKRLMGEFTYLVNCMLAGRANGYIYFEANAMQGIAEILLFPQNQEIILNKMAGLLHLVNEKELPIDSLPLYLANRALALFQRYGDWYQISGTYRTMASCYNVRQQPEKALVCLKAALQYVNRHHERFYHCTDTTDRLYAYVPGNAKPVELRWVVDKKIKTVPEWILRLREQLSCTYAAMDCKVESDYNRNIYLDLLDYTRQDKALESRYESLEEETRQLNYLLLSVGIGILLLVGLFVWLNRYWRKRNQVYLNRLSKTFRLCRQITSSGALHNLDDETLADGLVTYIGKDLEALLGISNIHISLQNSGEEELSSAEEEIGKDSLHTEQQYIEKLFLPGTHEEVGELSFVSSEPLLGEDRELLALILPYLAWAIKNGTDLLSLDDERRQLQKEQYVHELHLIENKRQNIVKKACFSIVTGMLPYIDRIINEVDKLNSHRNILSAEIKKEKVGYINELIGQINEYNDILALWVKMRQGALSLNIESFSLQSLFSVIEKGRRSFEMKQLKLEVSETQSTVKADKALTLFMINTLAENARKYTSSGGVVKVFAREEEKYVEISVEDTGMGLSQKDIACIVEEKVYDSSRIGMDQVEYAALLKEQKGHGFGLMNCKGIIDKYRKTNPLFQVCTFNIESVLGKGSRFYFRLPKGGKKILLWMGIFFSLLTTGCTRKTLDRYDKEKYQTVAVKDSLLLRANEYANKVYECNVNGRYAQALLYADSVLYHMNRHFLIHSGRKFPQLLLYDWDNNPAELEWLRQGFETDYYILLDVRNETAVAALALKKFELYYFNNMAYTVLYKQVSKDRSLEQYCSQMQQSANDKLIALSLLVFLILVCGWCFYLLVVRPRFRYRYNMEQVFIANESISQFIQTFTQADESFYQELLGKLEDEIKELMSFSTMILAIYDDENTSFCYISRSDIPSDVKYKIDWTYHNFDSPCHTVGDWLFFPLLLDSGEKKHCMGVLAVEAIYTPVPHEDKLLLELVVSSLSIMLYQVVVQMKQKYEDIEVAQDDALKVMYEENMLHIQNMVLDNCLSTIKHETVYYPNRIRQIMEKVSGGSEEASDIEKDCLLQVGELIGYYKEVFVLLSSCAARQLDEVTFRRSEVPVIFLIEQSFKYFRKIKSKLSYSVDLIVDADDSLSVCGDKVLLLVLIENLLKEALRVEMAGTLRLQVQKENDYVKFSFTDLRRTCSQEELNHLFYPQIRQVKLLNSKELIGTEFLVCKQILREHDEYGVRRGCRINAQKTGKEEFTIWFTIPLSHKRNKEN